MNKLDDLRYDLIYLNPEDNVGSRNLQVGDNYCILPAQTTLVEQKIDETDTGSNLESECSQLQLLGGPGSDGETKCPESEPIDVEHSVFGISHPDIVRNDDGFYYCRYCNNCRSTVKKEIIRHESTHLAPTHLCPFEKCGKKFSRKEHMHRHYRSHTGERPYQCPMCEKRFRRKDHMVKHERRKHMPKRLKCRFCIHSFIDRNSLATHEEIIHENKPKAIKIEVEIKKESNNTDQGYPEDISSVENSSSNQYTEDISNVENSSSNQYTEDISSVENSSSNQYTEDISNVESNITPQYPEVMLNVEIDSDRTDTSLCENDNTSYSCRFCSYSSLHRSLVESHERTHSGDDDGDDERYVENVLLKECYVKYEKIEDDELKDEEEVEEGEEVELDNVGGGGGGGGEVEMELDNVDEGEGGKGDGGGEREEEEEEEDEEEKMERVNVDEGGGGREEEEEKMERDYVVEGGGEREEEEEEKMERDNVDEGEDDSNEIEVDVNYSVLDKNPENSSLTELYTCTYCNKEFSRRFSLIRHTRHVHVGEPRQQCNICDKKYVRRDHLKKHLMAHLRKVERERLKNCFDRELCEKEEMIRYELEGFAKKSVNPFSGIVKLSRLKTSAAEGSWENQVQVVTGFDCRYCGEFTCDTRSELIAHEKSHGYRGFQCSYCDATFSRQHHLSRHVSTHTGERQFCCHVCDKSFYRKDHLDKHLRVHTGEKPFHCSFCDKAFSRQYTMRDHEKKHAEPLLKKVKSPSEPLMQPTLSL